jgi:Flp pilus assembly protein TadG
MLITRCTSVHSAFMRYPIDVVYLDRNGVVVRCVPHLKPWRASHSALGTIPFGRGAAHVLELAAGAISEFGIAPGARLSHPYWDHPLFEHVPPRLRQRGSAMIEFAVVGPLIAMLGLGLLQYGMLFFAKNQINYATFMAGREGSVAHADLGAVRQAYARALAPLYGGGENPAEVAEAVGKAGADTADNVRIELLNPTKESFNDWNDPALQTLLKTGGRRAIPNSALATKAVEVRTSSGQSLQDANLLKLKITHGYLPKVPFVSKLYLTYLKWLDPHNDAFFSKLVDAGRIPVVTHVTVEMQSDAIESDANVSIPGPGNGGKPTNPGDPPVNSGPPPECTNLGCEVSGPTPQPACNPFTDPNRCQSTPECVPSSQMCCIPPQWMPKT